MSVNAADVAVTIVSFDSSAYLKRCLDALAAQTLSPRAVVVVDNASRDDSAGVAERHPVVSGVLRNTVNTGFAAGQNRAIRATRESFVLALNPDAVLEPGFLAELAAHADGSAIGSTTHSLSP